MADPIEFWFDFSSPYAYIAAQRIEAVAEKHGRTVAWRPYLLGVAFRETDGRPLTQYPLKGPYSAHDMARTAREHGIDFALPEPFPVNSMVAARAFYWLNDRDPDEATAFAKAVYRAYFADGRNIGDPAVVLEIAAEQGLDADDLKTAVEDPAVKDKLKQATAEAVQDKGVFGAPFMIVDGEPFWGADRVDVVDRWLETGGW